MYGFGYMWLSHDVGNDDVFRCQFKQRLIDSYWQKWYSDISTSPKALHYSCFKSLLVVELYISLDMPFELRKVLANFRCCGHKIMIEMGRHDSIDAHFRFCPICLETDIHCRGWLPFLLWMQSVWSNKEKKVREKSREWHNHKPQPFQDTKRKRQPTNPNKHKSNKRTKSTNNSCLFPKRDNHDAKRTEKTQNDTR